MDESIVDDAFLSVIGPGVKLSIALYHYASPFGSAGDDMKDLGAEVTLFCAIMRQVHAVFQRPAKSFRISTTAINDVHDVLDRGKSLFEKVEVLLVHLQRDDSSMVDAFTRVKQTFRKSKVLMWKESLRSCTAMVQVMLTTMAFAERIASMRAPTPASQAEEEQLRDLMQSLLLAQQSTNTRLERLEDQTLEEEMEERASSAASSPNFLDADGQDLQRNRRKNHHRNRSSRAILDIAGDDTARLLTGNNQRTSIFLNRKLFQQENYEDLQRRTWTSLSDHRQSIAQSNDLLENWTDQTDPAPPYVLRGQNDYGDNFYNSVTPQKQPNQDPGKSQAEMHQPSPLDTSRTTFLHPLHSLRVSNGDEILSHHEFRSSNDLHNTNIAQHPPLPDPPENASLFAPTVQSNSTLRRRDPPYDTIHEDNEPLVTDSDGTCRPTELKNLAAGQPENACIVEVIFERWTMDVDLSFCNDAADVLARITSFLALPRYRDINPCELWVVEGDTLDVNLARRITTVELLGMGTRPREQRVPLILREKATGPPDEWQMKEALELAKDPNQSTSGKRHISKEALEVESYLDTADRVRHALHSGKPAMVEASHDHDVHDRENSHLTFQRGDTILVFAQFANGWWDGTTNGARGWFPSNYCRAIVDPNGEREVRATNEAAIKGQRDISAKTQSDSETTSSSKNGSVQQVTDVSQTKIHPDGKSGSSPSVEISKSFRVSLEDLCSTVLPAALRKYQIDADWRGYSLYVVYGDAERCIELHEKPLMIFKDLDQQGLRPMFMLRKLAQSNPKRQQDTG